MLLLQRQKSTIDKHFAKYYGNANSLDALARKKSHNFMVMLNNNSENSNKQFIYRIKDLQNKKTLNKKAWSPYSGYSKEID